MTNDLFNNPSNDYIDPGLSPCSNISDEYNFKFVDNGAGIISGSDIAQFMDLSDISIPISSWVNEKKTIQSGEVIYIPGLTKGLLKRTLGFNLPNFDEINQKYYMMVDLSINYYYNFKYYEKNIDASSNYSLNIDIDDAMNIELGKENINTTFTYDPSYFIINGNTEGYDFDITNIVLTIIDASMDSSSPFPAIIIDGERVPQTYTLTENLDLELPSAKYPNGAMLGYILKPTYPSTSDCNTKWLYMNNVVSPYDVYVPTLINNIIDISTYKNINFDPNITWGPYITDVSSLYTYDPSYGTTIDSSVVNEETITNVAYNDSSIISSVAIHSGLFNSYIEDSSVYGSDVSSGYIYNSYLINDKILLSDIIESNLQGVISNTNYLNNSAAKNSYLNIESSINNSTIEGSWINAYEYSPELWTNDVSCVRISIDGGVIHDTSINNSVLTDVSIYSSRVYDSSLLRCTLYNVTLDNNSTVDSSTRNIYINAELDASTSWSTDTSTFYTKYSKKIDVGRAAEGTSKILSASEYLDYINTNNLWDKVGKLAAKITTIDPVDSNTKNLIGGFYIFNPQLYPVQIEYLLLNR